MKPFSLARAPLAPLMIALAGLLGGIAMAAEGPRDAGRHDSVRTSGRESAGEVLRVAGSGANVGAITLLSQEFRKTRPDVVFAPIEAVGSGGAIKAVSSGALHIALASRPLTDKELALGLREIEYARTPFVIAVRQDSRVDAMTSERLAAILSGVASSGPDGVRPRPVLRPPSDVDTAILKSMAGRAIPALDEALGRSGMMIATTDKEAADLIESNPGAVGTTTLGLILSESRKLRPLAMDGAVPSLSALQNGQYPYQKRLFLVINTKSAPSEPVRAFVEHVSSASARTLLRRTGHLVAPFEKNVEKPGDRPPPARPGGT